MEYSSQHGGADANITTTENLETNHIPSINHVEQSGASSQSWVSMWWDNCRHADEFLDRSGTQCLNMGWHEYRCSRFDFLLVDACPNASRPNGDILVTDYQARNDFVEFCKTVLKSGSRALMYLPFDDFFSWKSAFMGKGIKVMNYPFLFHYAEEEVQYRGSSKSDLPQSCVEVAIDAKTQGLHPELFSPNFKSPASNSCLRHIPEFAHISSIKRTPA